MLAEQLTGIEKRFFELSEKIVTENGYELYDVEYISGSHTLRVFIMDKKTGSAVIEDCVAIDRAFTPYIEEADWMPEELVLEVSSPGVYRQLKTRDHFEATQGEMISIVLNNPLSEEDYKKLPKKFNKQKKLRGLLNRIDETDIIMDFDGVELSIALENIKKANSDPDF